MAKMKYKNVIDQTIEVWTDETCPLQQKVHGHIECELANAFCKHGTSNPCPLDQNGVVIKLLIYKKKG